MRSADKYCRCPPTPTDAASFSEFLNTARMNKPQVRKMSYSPAGLGSRSRVFLEPEPLGKKVWSRSRSKIAGSSALLEDKKHKEIVFLLLFFR